MKRKNIKRTISDVLDALVVILNSPRMPRLFKAQKQKGAIQKDSRVHFNFLHYDDLARRLKMIRIKTFIWLIILISAFNLNLFPYISSQVSGYVMDKETNTVLKDVDVYLMTFFRNAPIALPQAQTKTDENGYFIFDDVNKGTYFIECTKDGYEDFSPGYLAELPNREKYVKTFYIEEGVVKHFEIEMVKGGCLKVIIKKRDDNGVSGYGDIEFSLFAVVKDKQLNRDYICDIARFKTNEDGIRIIDGLHPDIIHGISIRNDGFPDLFKKDIIIKKNGNRSQV